MRSPIYWHRLIYRNTYGRSHPAFEKRFETVAELIEPGASVLDLCCGDTRLYTHYLSKLGCTYLGIDVSLSMVPHRALPYTKAENVGSFELPVVDYVVMMESFYHFYPDSSAMLKRMRSAARKKVIILEQVKNKINFLPQWAIRFLSDPGNGSGRIRFNKEQLEQIVNEADPGAEKRLLFNGYDLLIVMSGAA